MRTGGKPAASSMPTPPLVATSSTTPSTTATGRARRSSANCSTPVGTPSSWRPSTRRPATAAIPTRRAIIGRTCGCPWKRAYGGCAPATSTSTTCTSGMPVRRSRRPCAHSTMRCAQGRCWPSASATPRLGSRPGQHPRRLAWLGAVRRRAGAVQPAQTRCGTRGGSSHPRRPHAEPARGQSRRPRCPPVAGGRGPAGGGHRLRGRLSIGLPGEHDVVRVRRGGRLVDQPGRRG